MSALLDTSVLVASLVPDEAHHASCDRLLAAGGHAVYVHALAETFSILTGGRQGRRVPADVACTLIGESIVPFVRTVALTGRELTAALAECSSRGVRGGAVYDLLHLIAARKAGVERLVTLNLRDFQALARSGDPQVGAP